MSKRSSIPDELRTDRVDDGRGQSSWIETRTVEPVNGADQNQVRFMLPKEGILDDAYLTFQVKAAANNQVLPLWSGCMSAFATATLMCGGVQLAQSRGVNHLWTLKNFYRDPHNRNMIQSKRVGLNTGLMVDKLTGDAAADVGVWGVNVNQDDVSDPTADTRVTTEGYKITDDLATTPVWEVKIVDLFPLLYSNHLPLGLLKNSVSIVLDLQQELTRGDRTCCPDATWTAGTTYETFKLHIDLVFYEDDIGAETTMQKLQKKLDAGLSLNFTDYTYVLQQQPAAGTATDNQQVNTLLGLDHEIIRRIYISTPLSPDYGGVPSGVNSGNPLLGNYCSVGSNLKNTLQVTVNSEPYFNSPLDTDGKICNQLSQAFPTPFKMNQAINSAVGQINPVTGAYVAAQQLLTSKTMNGVSQQEQQGAGHYYGINLSKTYANVRGAGTAVGKQSVLLELKDQRCATGNLAKQVHIWAEVERQLLMAGGEVMVTGD